MKLLLLALILSSCASKPQIWKDKYGITHIESPSINAITWVKVVIYYKDIPVGCRRLRNIYLDGRGFKDWELKEETAKMQGDIVLKQYYNGVSDTMGIAYDCKNASRIRSMARIRNNLRHSQALSEAERRTFAKGHHRTVKDDIPVLKYNKGGE